MRIYTKSGDDGTTGLLYGGRVPKDDPRTQAYGSTDEAVAAIGLARSLGLIAEGLDALLLRIQRDLFIAGAELATDKSNTSKLKPGISKVTDEMISTLETEIDAMVAQSPLPEYFIVPGACPPSAALDLARSIVRRAERHTTSLARNDEVDPVVLRYLNRLSDFLFVAARHEENSRGLNAPPSKE
jgi:cob(I)alamin adenosyltransferase